MTKNTAEGPPDHTLLLLFTLMLMQDPSGINAFPDPD